MLSTGEAAVQPMVVGWGYNNFGLMTIPSGFSNIVAIAGGYTHSLALTAERQIVAWGNNDYGQTNAPSGLSNVVAIAGGYGHSLALTAEGRVVGWGLYYDYEPASVPVSIPSGLSNVVAIAGGYGHSLALTAEGRVVGWGYNRFGQRTIPSGLTNVVAISAGSFHSLALTAEGRVVGWGWNDDGQIDIPSGFSNVLAIAAGYQYNLGLTAEGRLFGWGFNGEGATNIPPGINSVVAIAAGSYHGLALTAEGRVVGWGRNAEGQTNIPSGLSNVVAIAGGGVHSLALTGDGFPAITGQTDSKSVNAGDTVTFQVWAVGMPPLRYQWLKDGTNLPAQTRAGLRLDGITPSHGGNYRLVMSNLTGSTTSSVATLTVNCLLNAVSTSGGSVTRNPDLPAYAAGSVVTLTARPEAGYGLIRWSGDAAGKTNPLTVSLDTNKNIMAVFASTALTLASQGVGIVTKVPNQAFYGVDEQVALNAAAGRWHVFSRWTDGNTDNPRLVTIGESNRYTAVFTPITTLETVAIGDVTRLAPVGMPAVIVDGAFVETNFIARGSGAISLLTTFTNGALLFTLDRSEPDVSSRLYGGPFAVTESATLRVIAYNADFTRAVQSDPVDIVILPTLSAVTAGGGSVAVDPPSGAYLSNGTAMVTATPAPGWTFLQWLGDVTGTNPITTVSMTRNKRVQADFGTGLSNNVVGSGSVARSPAAGLYPYGTEVRLTGVPQADNYFAFWANAASGTNNPLNFKIANSNPTVTAVFAALPANQHALTVLHDGFGQVSANPRRNRYDSGINVTLTVQPEAGQSFLGWSGDAGGTNNPLTVVMNSSKVITAQFTRRPRLAPVLREGMVNGEDFQLWLTGGFGEPFDIEAATNLASGAVVWTPVTTVTNAFGTVQFSDPVTTNRTQRFYRAVATPQL